eukprot:gnl/Trimastix_PCT/1561.p1 GENE.gnl/Trimastix_PCT/1561~~gnl/Trimastix_PCT/1561.p1  ORF type:complete len:918 (+),score=462.55 gnl/Trimastix_PCT/1561:99-2852(+)
MDTFEFTDLTHSKAFINLAEQFEAASISENRMEKLQSHYQKMYEVVIRKFENEKNLFKRAQALNQEKEGLEQDVRDNEKRAAENERRIKELRQQAAKYAAESSECAESDLMQRIQIEELQRQRDSLAQQLEALQKANRDLIEPQMAALQHSIAVLSDDFEAKRAALQRVSEEKQEYRQQIERLTKDKADLHAKRIKENSLLLKTKGDPDKHKKFADFSEQKLDRMREENDRAETEMLLLNNTIKRLNEQIMAQRGEEGRVQQEESDAANAVENAQRDIRNITSEIQHGNEERKAHDIEIVELEHSVEQYDKRLRATISKLQKTRANNDDAIRQHAEEAQSARRVETDIPRHELLVKNAVQGIKRSERENRALATVKSNLMTELDAIKLEITAKESTKGQSTAELNTTINDVKDYEAERIDLMNQERILDRSITDLSLQREMTARHAEHQKTLCENTKKQSKVQDIHLGDLMKKKDTIRQLLQQYSRDYEEVKKERNKNVAHIQESVQILAEMRERIKVLENEREILHNEQLIKEKALMDTTLGVQSRRNKRDARRLSYNKILAELREYDIQMDQQISDIDKLSATINAMEAQMLSLKKEYEYQVDQRNYTGIQLIQRNDELCILYEKANIQQTVSARGESEITKRDEDLRLLKITVGELTRERAALCKQLPQADQYLERFRKLSEELRATQEHTQQLSEQLESPQTEGRWNMLGGPDVSARELQQRIAALEERLNDKKEQLLEREHVLDELTSLSNHLRAEALRGRESTLSTATRVNAINSKIREYTRSIQSTMSESSIYEAKAVQLRQQRTELEEQLADARARIERGAPPTADCVHMVEEAIRRREVDEDRRRNTAAEEVAPGTIRTTAPLRYTAYIPDDGLGLPVPYPVFQQFRPTEPGASMRHIRAPKPKPIVF